MDKFTIADNKGRDKVIKAFSQLYPEEVLVPEDQQYSRYDLVWNSTKGEVLIECKDRNFPSTQYEDTLIDYNKVQWLQQSGKQYLLAISFTDGVVLLFNARKLISEGKYRLDNILCRKTTVVEGDIIESTKVYFSVKDASKKLQWIEN